MLLTRAEGPAVSNHAREGVVCIRDEFEGRRPGTAIVPHLRRSSLDANQSRPYGRAYSSAGPSGLNQFSDAALSGFATASVDPSQVIDPRRAKQASPNEGGSKLPHSKAYAAGGPVW